MSDSPLGSALTAVAGGGLGPFTGLDTAETAAVSGAVTGVSRAGLGLTRRDAVEPPVAALSTVRL